MDKFTGTVTGFSRALDKIAGLCMFSIMLLIVANIVLRAVFNHPLLGAYDYVVFLTVLTIALSLANCAIQNGHIAVDFVVDRLPVKVQAVIDLVMNAAAMFFWLLCAWQIGIYAKSMAVSGVVSSTAQIPVYPFIYLVAIGLLALSMVLLVRTMESMQKVFVPSCGSPVTPGVKTVKSMQKAAAVNK